MEEIKINITQKYGASRLKLVVDMPVDVVVQFLLGGIEFACQNHILTVTNKNESLIVKTLSKTKYCGYSGCLETSIKATIQED